MTKVLPSVPALQWDFEDPGDFFILDLIVHSKADFLITGDKKLRSLLFVQDTFVVTPVEFLGRL